MSTLLLPLLSAQAVDRVLTRGALGPLLGALGGLLVLRAGAEAGLIIGQAGVTSRIGLMLRRDLLRQVFAVGLPIQRRFPTGDLVNRLTSNAPGAARTVPAMIGATVATLASLAGLVALWAIDWWVGAVFVLAVLPAVLLIRRVMGGAPGAYADYLARLREISVRLADAVAGSRTIQAAGTESREVERVLGPLPDLVRAGRRTWALQRAVSWQLEFAVVAIRVVVLATAGLGLSAGRISPGQVVAVSLLVTVALGFLYQADTLLHLMDTRANAARVREVLTHPGPDRSTSTGYAATGYRAPGAESRPGTDHDPEPAATLALRDVSVSLDGRSVLRGVDLDVPAGQAVALVGRSGAGKSTLALLVGGLLTPDSGTVLLDGVPVDGVPVDGVPVDGVPVDGVPVDGVAARSAPPPARRQPSGPAVSYAFDRPVLLGRTIRDAVSYGRPGLPTPTILHALRLTHAEDFVRRLPAGLDTPLAEAPLSGGELQRLGLARAVLHPGRVLVLDDATSSLDTVTEARVSQALTERLAGRTRLVIAHRAGTAAHADLVAWLHDGRIRALAPHDRLWATEPDYRAAFGSVTEPEPGPGPDQALNDANSRVAGVAR